MEMKFYRFTGPLVSLLLCFIVEGERTKNKIYVDVTGKSACFRRLNGTHQIGCSSEPKGNVGVVHYLKAESDTKWLLEKGPHKPYAVLLNATDFTLHNLTRLKDSGKVNGIMVIHLTDTITENLIQVPEAFSPDKKCPLNQHGMYKGHPDYEGCKDVTWNPGGNNMMFHDISFPVFILTNTTEVDFIINNCYEKFNKPDSFGQPRQHPLCAAQLKDRMDGAKDAETCIRRTRHQMNLSPNKYCDPMGDKNVYATVKVINNTMERPEKSVVMAVTRMDSFSMFEEAYPSADNQVSGIVAMLAAAEAIGKVKETVQQADKDIMFTFFQGEAFDYIGSGRMVYEMERGNFPLPYGSHLAEISLRHISSIVEVNQLAHRDDGKLWIHRDPVSGSNATIATEVDRLMNLLKTIGQSLGTAIDSINQSQALPPASVQSFLKKRNISAVVITDHKEEFTNKYYNSRFDTKQTINASYPADLNKTDWYDHVTEQAERLAKVSTLLARYLYKEATGEATDLSANESTVTHLLYCFLISPQCELFGEVLSGDKAKELDKRDKPYQFYVGVDWQINEVTSLTNQLMLRYLGEPRVNVSEKDCKRPDGNNIYQYSYMQGPEVIDPETNKTVRDSQCWRGTANFSTAASKAFELDEYDWKSGEFSTWTESSWAVDAQDMRLFLIPSKTFETTTLSIGIVLLVVPSLLIYFINKRSDVLFRHPGPYRNY